MGAWGGGLYSNDTALDLRTQVSLLSKIPKSGDEILDILVRSNEWIYNETGKETDIFWYVVADQFEKRGITCEALYKEALGRLKKEPGSYVSGFRDVTDKRSWMKSIGKLRDRLQNPRPIKPRPKSKKPPAFALQLGGAYTFPTMQGKSFTPWFSSWEKAEFHPDGYGALIVLRQGRVFD